MASQDAAETSLEAFTGLCQLVRDVDFGHDMLASYPSDRVWALLNVSKKLYVRLDGVPTIDNEKNLTYEGHNGLRAFPGIGHVLLANNSWSNNSMGFSNGQGSWTGVRIDVRLLDDVMEMQEEGWKDIS